MHPMGFWDGAVLRTPPANSGDAGDAVSTPGLGRSPVVGNGNCSSILVWDIPWTEKPGGLQSMGLQRVRHDWVCTHAHTHTTHTHTHTMYPTPDTPSAEHIAWGLDPRKYKPTSIWDYENWDDGTFCHFFPLRFFS